MSTIATCSCCGLSQLVPPIPVGMRAGCARCGTSLRKISRGRQRNEVAAATALAALILYPLAVSLPIMVVQQLGHTSETSILGGVAALLADGQLAVGLIVLLCSVIFPLGKLIFLLALSWAGGWARDRHRALTYQLIEFTGRWGMLDVLAVAILVAALKLGNVMDVQPGPGALAFCVCVTLSLVATALFDPHALWEQRP